MRSVADARSSHTSARVRVSEMQRSRLLSAAVATIEELGYARMTVAHITSRARVSRRTFYDLFDNREDCLLAVMEDTVGLIASELAGEGIDGLPWRERMRTGLWTILCFFDREPVWRGCVWCRARVVASGYWSVARISSGFWRRRSMSVVAPRMRVRCRMSPRL